ncbi:hypothetical protein BDZ91DRAFT_250837 [Kalaharituber pfeilii]|nr:hypothetical protein BDZ91DRAFT_250837 [Kalaharituber pfeilii]
MVVRAWRSQGLELGTNFERKSSAKTFYLQRNLRDDNLVLSRTILNTVCPTVGGLVQPDYVCPHRNPTSIASGKSCVSSQTHSRLSIHHPIHPVQSTDLNEKVFGRIRWQSLSSKFYCSLIKSLEPLRWNTIELCLLLESQDRRSTVRRCVAGKGIDVIQDKWP